MKNLLTLMIMLVTCAANAQYYDYDLAVADIDMDGVADTVRIDRNAGVIVCSLSSLGFEPLNSLPMECLTDDGLMTHLHLSAGPRTFHLSSLGNRASSHFIFVYDKRRKNIYLSEHWAETLGNVCGSGASNFEHDVLRGRVDYWVRYYGGSISDEEYEEDNYFAETAKKRVAKMRISLELFSVEDYFQRTEYIWNELL